MHTMYAVSTNGVVEMVKLPFIFFNAVKGTLTTDILPNAVPMILKKKYQK